MRWILNCTGPQLAGNLSDISDLLSYVRRFLEEESPVAAIKSEAEHFEGADFYKADVRASVFRSCTFSKCGFENASFTDVLFENCDFSNSRFIGACFERCRFTGCKCVGVNMRDTAFRHTSFEQSNLRYSLFDKTAMTDVSFDCIDFTEASVTEAKLKRFSSNGSRFVRNNFCRTMLAAVDFTEDEFAAPIVSSPPSELKGAVVSLTQAADLAAIWGVVVKR
jgi:uncharacterized protein YjbI with pentapeptide repeats